MLSNEYDQVFERYVYEYNKRPFDALLSNIEDIIKLTDINQRQVNTATYLPPEGWRGILGSTINKITLELTSKIKTAEKEAEKTKTIHKILSSYSWNAKMVMVLAALVVKYGKLCLVSNWSPHDPVARSVALLRRQCSVVAGQPSKRDLQLKEWQKTVSEMINKMSQLTEDVLKRAHSVKSAHLIIQCAIVCSSQMITALISDEHVRGVDKPSHSFRLNFSILENELEKMLREEDKDPIRLEPALIHRDHNSIVPRAKKDTNATEEEMKNHHQEPPKSKPEPESKPPKKDKPNCPKIWCK